MIAIKALLAGLVTVSVCMAINISGIVTDTGGNPIAGASVRLETSGDTATTKADGSFTLGAVSSIKSQLEQITPKLSASILNGILYVNLQEKSSVEISTYNLQGKAISTIQKNVDAGNQSVALQKMGAGVYLYKVKMGKTEFLLKSNSAGGVVQGSVVNAQSKTSHTALAKQAKVMSAINDVIASTKDGYLNYRCVQYSSDTTGIKIKMIVCAGTVKDTDGNVYQTVKIGNQVWTIENLRTTKYNDGSAITNITANAVWLACSSSHASGYCYYNNTTNTDSINKFGALYNWYTVHTGKLAPAGWHVPTDSEWEVMQSYLVMHGYNYDGTTDTTNNKIAIALAAKTDWATGTLTGTIGKNLPNNNSSGFSALPGGFRNIYGYFSNTPSVIIGNYGIWWSATDITASYAWYRSLYYGDYYLYRSSLSLKSCGYSVKLVKDN